MERSVPDYIFVSGLNAQLARNNRRRSATPVSRPTSQRTTRLVNSDDLDMPMNMDPAKTEEQTDKHIKDVVGHIAGAHRAWPAQLEFDVPRLVQL